MDIERHDQLEQYLRHKGHLRPGEAASFRTLVGGVSNKTVLVQRGGGDWVVKQALPALRVAAEWLADPARIHREALALRHVPAVLPDGSCPRLVFHHPDDHLLAMTAVPEPHDNLKSLFLSPATTDADIDRFGRGLGELLGQLHASTADRALPWRSAFDDRRFFESLRIDPYYRHTLRIVPDAADWLTPLLTSDRRDCIVHGDFSPKNVLVHGGRLVLLDHEVIHLGDPAFDLGFCLTHLLSKAHHLARPAFGRAASTFVSAWTRRVSDLSFAPGARHRSVAHTLACLLARVHGKSPLEYLTAPQREKQSSVVQDLARRMPNSPEQLITSFTEAVL